MSTSRYFMCVYYPEQNKTDALYTPFLTAGSEIFQFISDLHCNFALKNHEHIVFIIRQLKPTYKWLTKSIRVGNHTPEQMSNYVSLLDVGNLEKHSTFSDETVRFDYVHDVNTNHLNCTHLQDDKCYSLSFTATHLTIMNAPDIYYSHPYFTITTPDTSAFETM